MCVYMHLHTQAHVEARGQHQISAFITPLPYISGQGLPLNLELPYLSWAGCSESPRDPPVCLPAPQLAGEPHSEPHTCALSRISLSILLLLPCAAQGCRTAAGAKPAVVPGDTPRSQTTPQASDSELQGHTGRSKTEQEDLTVRHLQKVSMSRQC